MVMDLDRLLVSEVAYSVTRSFPSVPVVDVREDLWRWYSEHPRIVSKAREIENEKAYRRAIARHLRNRALRYCHQRRAEQIGYEVDDLSFYSKALIRELLGAALLGGQVTAAKDPGSRGSARPSEGGNLQVAVIDVRRAFESLRGDVSIVVSGMVSCGFDVDETAAYLGVDAAVVERLYNRGLTAMQRFLGGPAPGPDESDDLEEEELDESMIVALVREAGIDLSSSVYGGS